jgi:hypothetical protein
MLDKHYFTAVINGNIRDRYNVIGYAVHKPTGEIIKSYLIADHGGDWKVCFAAARQDVDELNGVGK